MNYWFYIGYAYRSIVWKYIFLLPVLNKNENFVNAGYFLIAKLVPAKQKKSPIRKKKFREKFLSHSRLVDCT